MPLAASCLEWLEGNLRSSVPPHPPSRGKQARDEVHGCVVLGEHGQEVAAPGGDKFIKRDSITR